MRGSIAGAGDAGGTRASNPSEKGGEQRRSSAWQRSGAREFDPSSTRELDSTRPKSARVQLNSTRLAARSAAQGGEWGGVTGGTRQGAWLAPGMRYTHIRGPVQRTGVGRMGQWTSRNSLTSGSTRLNSRRSPTSSTRLDSTRDSRGQLDSTRAKRGRVP